MQTKHLAVPFQIKGVDEEGVFEGYGSVFDVEDSWKDIVLPGAFRRTLREWKKKGALPAMLWQHDTRKPVGVYDEMREDDRGLYVKGRLVLGSTGGKDAYEFLKAGAVSGLSIGYWSKLSEYDSETGIRKLKDVDLWEVSLVTFPANDVARVASVKAADSIKTIRDFEEFLREEGGFSHAAAKAIAASGFKAKPDPRDEDGEGALNRLLADLKSANSSLRS